MSAPIDDLLYGGDDSGDEVDMTTSVAMPSFSSPMLSNTTSLTAIPPSLATAAPSGTGLLSSNIGGVRPPVIASSTANAGSTTAMRTSPGSTVTAQAVPPAVSVAAATKQQTPGSGQQMFQQMFALLKQMLPAEQYATLHSEMRKGNGNDIKSIVDIIKRIAGDAIFSSVIQKMDLTRTFPANSGGFNTVKPEPATAVGSTASTAGTPGFARPLAAPATVSGAAAPIIQPSVPRVGITAAAPTAAAQRPTLVQAAKPAAVTTPVTKPAALTTATNPAAIKPEPKETPATTASSAASNASAQSKNEALEKIQFAKRLLFHASTCTLAHGVCQVKKCDDVRRVFKHSVSCGGARGCSHCEQLKGLVKYHVKECPTPVTEHCAIPFCDGLRRTYAATTATLAAKAKNTPQLSTASKLGGTTSDDDDDNTPLSSAVNKVKKNAVKSKSPKLSPAVRTSTASSPSTAAQAANAAAKKKLPTATPPSKPGTPSTGTSSNSASPASAQANKGAKNSVTANMTLEYGRLLQLILHVQKCTTSVCPVGDECAEAKALLRQIHSPNAPARAKTYKQVYAHYKVCLAKNNTANCPMCKIGLRPIISATTSSPSPQVSPNSQSTPTAASASGTNTSNATVTSPSISSLKRSNSIVSPSPRSPSKKQKMMANNRGKAGTAIPDPAQGTTDPASSELAQASVADIRKEADVLTHTNIELGSERRTMMSGMGRRRQLAEQLMCKKEEWAEKDLFNSTTLTAHMQEVARRCGVHLGPYTSDVMAYALHEYLKQVAEEMVEVAKQRSDAYGQAFEQMEKKKLAMSGTDGRPELTSSDILRVSCEDSFTRVRQEDLALRTRLLEDAKREELAEKERAKRRKKVDRSKLAQDEKDEAEMDMEELAIKDLKDRLLREDKDGVVKVEGRVNESIASTFTRRADNQVTMEDANYWLVSQKPYIKPKLFVRAEAARIVTKSLL